MMSTGQLRAVDSSLISFLEVSDPEPEDCNIHREIVYRHLELRRHHPDRDKLTGLSRYSLLMVYIKSWNEYQTKAEQLYTEHPTRVRLRITRCASRLIQEFISSALLHPKDPILRKIPGSAGNTGTKSDGR